MQEQMSGAAMSMPQDPKAAFKAEWEALEITEHKWSLSWTETDVLPTLKGIKNASNSETPVLVSS